MDQISKQEIFNDMINHTKKVNVSCRCCGFEHTLHEVQLPFHVFCDTCHFDYIKRINQEAEASIKQSEYNSKKNLDKIFSLQKQGRCFKCAYSIVTEKIDPQCSCDNLTC
jgi:hypothetical protein